MRIGLIGTNHRVASVEVRERLAVGDRLDALLGELSAVSGVAEAMIVNTCNRVEVLYVDGGVCAGDLESVLARYAGMPVDHLTPHLLRLRDEEAVEHLFRVCSSLDSLVLGESQITGQVKEGYRKATEFGSVGPTLHRLLHKAFAVAKRVRTETGVGTSAVSVASAAVDLAARVFDELPSRPVLLLGAGEMGELALKGFVGRGCRDLWVANRTMERAVDVATRHDAAVLPWGRRDEFLKQADVILCSTGAREPVLTRSMVSAARRARRGRPLFLIDISVPRNLDPSIRKLDPVYLFDVDDLGRAIDEGHAARKTEAQKAERIVDGEVTAFGRVLAQVHTAPLLRAMNLKVRQAAEVEVERTWGKLQGPLQGLDEPQRAAVRKQLEAMAGALGKRFLHDPMQQVRKLGDAGQIDALGDAARLLGVEATLLAVREGDKAEQERKAAVGDDG